MTPTADDSSLVGTDRAEQLRQALGSGQTLILSDDRPTWTPGAGTPPPAELTVDAAVLRSVLLGHMSPDPRGLHLHGAIITGPLDLNDVELQFGLELKCCLLLAPLRLVNTHLRQLSLRTAQLTGADGDGNSLVADGLRVEGGAFLDEQFTAAGAVRLAGAHIAGQLILRTAQLTGANRAGSSLAADGLRVDGGAFLSEHFTAAGAVRLVRAHIGGQLSLRTAQLTGANGDSLVADGLRVEGDAFLDEQFTAAGAVRLAGAHIAGQLSLRAAQLTGADGDGNSLVADGLRVQGDAFLDGQFTTAGAVRLVRAHIAGRLALRTAQLTGANGDGNSLVADGLRVQGDAFLDGQFTAAGAVRLAGAHIAGQLSLRTAQLTGANRDGNSLVADRLRIDGDAFLDDQFTAAGAVRLAGAHIAGQLALSTAQLTGADGDGDSLVADRLRTEGGAFLDDQFTAAGAVRLAGAHITGQLDLRTAQLTGANRDGNSLAADGLRVDSDALLDNLTAAGGASLAGAMLKNLLTDGTVRLSDASGWQLGDLHGPLRTDRRALARWLNTQRSAQPWQELAAVYERNGQPNDARWIRYRSAVRSTRNASVPGKVARTLYRVTTGHGYYPLLTLGWLLAIFVVAFVLADARGDDFTTIRTAIITADLDARAATSAGATTPTTAPKPPYPGRVPAAWCTSTWDVECLSAPLVALTTAFPAAAAGQPWSPPSGWCSYLIFGLRLLAWVFTALLLAGVTGLLRRQT